MKLWGINMSSFILLLFLSNAVVAYRLNVPRVLLPYHPTIPVKFELIVGQPSGGCFHWRSTRPDLVVVNPIGVRPGECSDRTEVHSIAKSAIGEMTAVIFAEDTVSGTTLSCGVSVDHVAKIHIESTTTVLFVDASPVRMIVQAYNKEGHHFSTLSSIPFEWNLVHNGDSRPLRIVPFEQSTYEAPAEIISLEKERKKGYVVLVEGIITGSSTLSAKLSDSAFKSVAPHSLDLTVVANLLLLPAHDVYIPIHSVVPFTVLIIKQHSTEDVAMPSPLYYLHVDSPKVCSLDVSTSSIYSESRGETEIHLLTHNVDLKAKTGVRPPSTVIKVVEPETLQWSVNGDNWFLETGKTYTLHVSLFDVNNNLMFIASNLRFESLLSSEHFQIYHTSLNGTHFVVTPTKTGKTVLKSKLVSVVNKEGTEEKISSKVYGEQTVYIGDPVRIKPKFVALPHIPKKKSHFELKVFGGSGMYDWSVVDSSVCNVEASGLVSSGTIGTTTVTASDRRNTDHFDTATVSVLEVLSLSFGETIKEAEVGKSLVLNVQLYGDSSSGPTPFTDCTSIEWAVDSADSSIFEPVFGSKSSLPRVGTGCATISLLAVSPGETKVTVSFGHLRATVDVSAFDPIKVKLDSISIAVGGELMVGFEGGVRPWILSPSDHYISADSADFVSADVIDGSLRLRCFNTEKTGFVRLTTGNTRSESLPHPQLADISIPVCCAYPTRLSIVSLQNKPSAQCPSKSHILLSSASLPLSVEGYGVCGGTEVLLQSISSLKVKWSSENKKLKLTDGSKKSPLTSLAVGQGEVGPAVVTAAAYSINGKSSTLRTSTNVMLVEQPSTAAKNLLLWNEAAKTDIVINGGSGHFSLIGGGGMPFSSSILDNIVTVVPRTQGSATVRISDSCLSESEVDVHIKISDIHSLVLLGPKLVEVGSDIEIRVEPADEIGSSFSRYQGSLADSKVECSNMNLQYTRRNGNVYSFRASAVGGVSLTASARSSSGRSLVSRPLQIQVFSPIVLLPKIVTLIPQSTFQLEVVGGPQPTPPIEFSLNDSKIATVKPNALITSQKLGYTSVTGTVGFENGHFTKDTVVVRVVSLAGVRFVASSRTVETGGRVWIRLEGIDSDENPFAFGGALYPFKVTWSLSQPDLLHAVHPLGPTISETSANKFAVWFDANSVGTVTVTGRVEMSSMASKHFQGSNTVFEATIDIKIDEAFALIVPGLPIGVIRIAPNSQLEIETSWESSTVEFSVTSPFDNLISAGKEGILRSNSREGLAALTVRRVQRADNETSLVPVVVSTVHSLDVYSSTDLVPNTGTRFLHVPVGVVLDLHVVFRDRKGRALHAAANTVSFRPHRFDLTEIVASSGNRSLSVTMKSAGETVLKIWDTTSPSIFVFVRLSAKEALLYDNPNLFVSDLICFKSPLAGDVHWFSSDSSIHWIDPENGVARLAFPGHTHVTAKGKTQSLHTEVSIGISRELHFIGSLPSFVSNIAGSSHVFLVSFSKNDSRSATDCTAAQREVLKNVRPPIDCSLSFANSALGSAMNMFSTKAIYSTEAGSYACKIEPQSAGSSFVDIVNAVPTDLTISAKWHTDSVESENEVKTSTVFHMAMEVIQAKVLLTDLDSASSVVSVVVPTYQLHHVSLSYCNADKISISEIRNPQPDNHAANKFFKVKLNLKSAVLWREETDKCDLLLENSLTGQKLHIPVQVRLLGKASKHVYDALDSPGFLDFVLIFLQNYSWIIPPLMWTCLLGIACVGAYWYLRHMGERSGAFGSANDSVLSNRSMFAPSDASSLSFRDSTMSPGNLSRRQTSGNSRIGSLNDDHSFFTSVPIRRGH